MNGTSARIPLLGRSCQQWEAWLAERGESVAHAAALLQQIHRHGECRAERMDCLPRRLRLLLSDATECVLPEVAESRRASDGTHKWLLRLACGNVIETVLIPGPARTTLCISSQAGCALGCAFCRTARSGFGRNLTAHEIVAQLWLVRHRLRPETPITNVVFMGMGEPLANPDAVLAALALFQNDHAYALGRRRITVSTAGLVPGIDRLRRTEPVSLAVSLHAPDDALRTRLMPINARYPMAALLAACRRYVAGRTRKHTVTVEYALLDGVNDSHEQARALARRLEGLPAKVNLIPFNPFPGSGFAASGVAAQNRFGCILREAGIVTLTRRPRGGDIAAACGQLAGEIRPRVLRPLAPNRPAMGMHGGVA